jgi:hypothetical protein
LRDETLILMRQELALAKTEMSEKAGVYGRNAGYLAAGALVAYAGAIFILLALSLVLAAIMVGQGVALLTALWAGSGIVGILVAIIGAVLVMKAKNAIENETLTPTKTVETLKEDKEWIRKKVKH